MRRLELTVAAVLLAALPVSAAEPSAPDFGERIQPLLKDRCVRCHGPAKQEGKLNLAVPAAIVRGGENGRAIVPGQPDESLLWQRVAADEMPEDEPLPPQEKTLLRAWSLAGAPGLPERVSPQADGDEHYAFQVIRPVAVPKVRDASRLRTPIDRFVQARLESRGLTLGPEADRATLIRRVCFDLTGLPPTPAEIDAFLKDGSGRAYQDMVDRYLASPAYGQRWGKYWLDAAGYADSNGYFGADTHRPLAYRYRDYVVRSLNADKPLEQFIREQLAGDALANYRPDGDVTPAMIESLQATHYLRNGPDGTDSSDGNADEIRGDKFAVLEGTLQIMGSSLFGLTIQCARCHDHKFEPLTQRDYYQLQAILGPAFNVDHWIKPKEREIVAASAAELALWTRHTAEIDEQIAARYREYRDWASANRERSRVLFRDDFDGPGRKLIDSWSNAVPGDEAAAGQPGVNIDSPTAPGAQIADGELRIVESRDAGDRAFSTRQIFDWTPDELQAWIQVTFDLLPSQDPAPYVAYFLALRDFNDARGMRGGNVLIDGAVAGQAAVTVDYPGTDASARGKIGSSGYAPGRNYGVRITNRGEGKYSLSQVVDGLPEDNAVMLTAEDLPDGGFGFEYCCGRSFSVDNVLVETSRPIAEHVAADAELAELRRRKQAQLDGDIKVLEAKKVDKSGRLAVVVDPPPQPVDVFVLERGDYKSPKEKVVPRTPAFLETQGAAVTAAADVAFEGANPRLALARWLTAPDSRAASLLARVTVNRWWQYHFGTGIVATAENLGYSGAPPTHPELLDFLAGELIRGGWSAKAMHRLILYSAVYRQGSVPSAENQRLDPDDRLLGHYRLRRLDAEAIRDAMLAVSGELDTQAEGPYVPTSRDSEGDVVVEENVEGSHRRSLFLQQRRTQVVGILEAFDTPSIVTSCVARPTTTVPLQSLKLLNSQFVRARAAALAERIGREAGDDPTARIGRAFLLCLGRVPTADERAAASEFLAKQPAAYAGHADATARSWTDFCQMLLASNGFMYLQ